MIKSGIFSLASHKECKDFGGWVDIPSEVDELEEYIKEVTDNSPHKGKDGWIVPQCKNFSVLLLR